ncbi:MAG: hypothetical protein U5L00_20805 [Desulfovermiculus sp.]|nr:hypothetical protein [Desulfovermiculus sp.]
MDEILGIVRQRLLNNLNQGAGDEILGLSGQASQIAGQGIVWIALMGYGPAVVRLARPRMSVEDTTSG